MDFRLIPPNETVPASVYRHLLPQEMSVITVRFHPTIIAIPVLTTVGGLITAIILSLMGVSWDAAGIIWFTWLLVLIYTMERTYRWFEDYFVITAQRMLLVTGVLVRDVTMIPISRTTNLRFRRTIMGRIFGYGTFIVPDAGWGNPIRHVSFLPYPEQLYLEVCGLIYPDKTDDD